MSINSSNEYNVFFADIILPLPIVGSFIYRIPQNLNHQIVEGIRVLVQFGKNKFYTGIVSKVHSTAPNINNVKYIINVVDEKPIVTQNQFKLWNWISKYYICTLGEVMNNALPSGFKLMSETKVTLNKNFNQNNSDLLNEKEFLVFEALNIKKSLTLSEIGKITNLLRVIHVVNNLLEKGVIELYEEINDKYKPLFNTFVSLAEDYKNAEKLEPLIQQLEKRAFKQVEIIITYLKLSNFFSSEQKNVTRSQLAKESKSTSSQIDVLVKKGVFQLTEKQASRIITANIKDSVESIRLTSAQQTALSEIEKSFKENKTALLKGVTSSGKTEIYIKLINKALQENKQVLYLLPEIALTTQIIKRLQKYFGDKIGVYHSKYSDNERIEIWNNVNKIHNPNESRFSIIIGARSAIFLPFNNLGLIIVDEEHDTGFKQSEMSPRYNARDLAIMLGKIHNSPVLLGSATPSIESYYNALIGKFKLINLKERYGGVLMPIFKIVDMKDAIIKNQVKSMFSLELLNELINTTNNGKQAILFQNRRGFSVRLECDVCNHIVQCEHCDVTLVYHKNMNLLKCHYCGFSIKPPEKCSKCGNKPMKLHGYGTEKVEDAICTILPNVKVQRMDLDTTKRKYAHEKIISNFENNKTNILVGTQMITKGLDFENVNLVGILFADSLFSYPDFRAIERSFQLITQVSGRAGRKDNNSMVIIQTYNKNHIVLKWIINNDYDEMATNQLVERKKYNYPPFYRLTEIVVKHKNSEKLNEYAYKLANMLKVDFGKYVIGPEYPIIARIKNYYIKKIIIKIKRDSYTGAKKVLLQQSIDNFWKLKGANSFKIEINVDPY